MILGKCLFLKLIHRNAHDRMIIIYCSMINVFSWLCCAEQNSSRLDIKWVHLLVFSSAMCKC